MFVFVSVSVFVLVSVSVQNVISKPRTKSPVSNPCAITFPFVYQCIGFSFVYQCIRASGENLLKNQLLSDYD